MNTIRQGRKQLKEELLLRLPLDFENQPDITVEWIHSPGNQDVSLSSWQSSHIEQLPERSSAFHTTVLVPNEWLSLTEIELPAHLVNKQSRNLSQTLNFLVEEQVATDIDQLHVAIGSQNSGKTTVAVIERSRLRNVLNLLKSFKIDADTVIPEGLTLPLSEDSVSLLLDAERVVLRADKVRVVSTNRANLKVLLENWAPGPDVSEIRVIATAENLAEECRLCLESIAITHNIKLNTEIKAPYSIDPDRQHWLNPVNLLQGEFAPTKKKHSSTSNVKIPLTAAGILFFLYVSYLIIGGLYFNSQSDTKYQQTEELYRNYFPNDRRIVNIRAQTQNHLNKSDDTRGSFTELLGLFVLHWQPNAQALEIQQIRYNQKQGEMIIELNSKSIDELDRLQQSLTSSGLKSELLSAIEEDKWIRGRLKLITSSGDRI